MSKIIKNTTGLDIDLDSVGLTIAALSSYNVEIDEYTLWASEPVIAEVSPLITSGDLVVNDGLYDLVAFDGINYLKYPDFAFNIRFLSDPERLNGFVSKDVQRAIEEAKTGAVPVTPTTTVDATPTVAYSLSLVDDQAYEFDARVIARGTVADLEVDFQQAVTVRRRSGGGAEVVGNIFQKRANRSSSGAGTEICWVVSGNEVRLEVTGLAATVINWQPQIEFEKVG